MLIDDPRIEPLDREHWRDVERYDRKIASYTQYLDKLERRAIHAIREWASAGDGVCSVSWGKDSVVAAHLTVLAGVDVPFVWVPTVPFETPGCAAVRDAFLADHDVECQERPVIPRNAKRGEPGFDTQRFEPGYRSQDVLAEQIHERYISGIRAQESRMRTMSIRSRGMVTKRTCRPLAGWRGPDVFAYMLREHLPVHPSYAMTYGGRLDRQWLRVHPLCSYHASHLDSISAWEDHYYSDVIAEALAQRREWAS